ncbi:MAG: hypothetical protein A2Y38_24535 [Spirochaetes bacterium GWB1_59_5]|nr:MAG: hypothetical protein A2Y38_24535 [Spirochaetes bacterium GWB1_59_5]
MPTPSLKMNWVRLNLSKAGAEALGCALTANESMDVGDGRHLVRKFTVGGLVIEIHSSDRYAENEEAWTSHENCVPL